MFVQIYHSKALYKIHYFIFFKRSRALCIKIFFIYIPGLNVEKSCITFSIIYKDGARLD